MIVVQVATEVKHISCALNEELSVLQCLSFPKFLVHKTLLHFRSGLLDKSDSQRSILLSFKCFMAIEGYVGKTVDPRTSGRLSSEISRRDFLTEVNAIYHSDYHVGGNCNKGTNANLTPTAKIKTPFEYVGICSPPGFVPGF
jgi:hypothetical protein